MKSIVLKGEYKIILSIYMIIRTKLMYQHFFLNICMHAVSFIAAGYAGSMMNNQLLSTSHSGFVFCPVPILDPPL